MLQLLELFTGNRPDAIAQVRKQVENQRKAGEEMVARADAQLAALEQLEALVESVQTEPSSVVAVRTKPPPLKKAILAILDESPELRWHRYELYGELMRRGWGPGGTNPRNTFTSRLRDLEKEKRLRRIGRDQFTSLKGVDSD